jgi:hypothetical protein
MKAIPLILALGACALGSPIHAQDESTEKPAPAEKKSSGYWEKLSMRDFTGADGMVIVSMPFPDTWKIARAQQQGQPTITGPNGIQIYDFPLRHFMFPKNPSLRQAHIQTGNPMRPAPDIDGLFSQELVPLFANMGLKLVKHYEIPELTRIDQWYSDQLFKAVPGPNRSVAIGSDWENPAGDPHFLITHYSVGETNDIQTWSHWSSGLQAEKEILPKARKQLIFALANARHNPEKIMAYNRSEAEKAGKSWADFNKRMAANQAAFEAHQRAHVNRSNAINDAIMNGWRARNAASDIQQERFIDTINEKSNVVDPTSGQRYKVDAGSNTYWMNRDGQYIGTDKPYYDPNLDEGLNEQNWQKLQNVK